MRELNALRERHGVLAITAHVMIPLDAYTNHVLRSESGVDQLAIDILNIQARRAP